MKRFSLACPLLLIGLLLLTPTSWFGVSATKRPSVGVTPAASSIVGVSSIVIEQHGTVPLALFWRGIHWQDVEQEVGPPGTVPFKLYWSAAREDNFTTATEQGERDAKNAGYRFARTEGYVYSTQQPGTVPLKLYWSAARGDNFTTATTQGGRDAQAAGYGYARIEGYIFPSQQPGTVPLKLYWSAARGDNFVTATAQGERDAKNAGYRFARIEGYVFPVRQLPPDGGGDRCGACMRRCESACAGSVVLLCIVSDSPSGNPKQCRQCLDNCLR